MPRVALTLALGMLAVREEEMVGVALVGAAFAAGGGLSTNDVSVVLKGNILSDDRPPPVIYRLHS